MNGRHLLLQMADVRCYTQMGFNTNMRKGRCPSPHRPFIPSSAGFLDAAAQRPLSLWQQRQRHPMLTTSRRRGAGVAMDRAAACRALPFLHSWGKESQQTKTHILK